MMCYFVRGCRCREYQCTRCVSFWGARSFIPAFLELASLYMYAAARCITLIQTCAEGLSCAGYPLVPAMAAKEAAADLPTMATQVLALAAQASTDGNLMPSGWNVPKGQMQCPSDILPSGFQLTAPLLNSFPSLESYNTQCYLPRASKVSAGGLCCGSPSLTPRAVGNKPPKVTGVGNHTAWAHVDRFASLSLQK